MKLSNEAIEILDDIGNNGLRLAIPRDESCKSKALLISDNTYPAKKKGYEIRVEVANELIRSGILGELTEFSNNNKLGWREMNLPGEQYHIYCCIQ